MQITRNSSSDRRVLRRDSTTSTGERPAKGFPLVAVGEVRRVKLNGLRVFMAVGGSFREAMVSLLAWGTRFLRVSGSFRGGVFGCREARLLSEGRVA